MNKNILFLLFILISSTLIAQQEDKSDVVFPIKGKPIKNCIVIDIGPGNMINYQINSDTLSVLSKAYIKNGTVISVYNNSGAIKDVSALKSKVKIDSNMNLQNIKNYYQYENLYHKYRKQSRIGIPFLGAGVLLLTSGLGIYYTGGDFVEYYFNDSKGPATVLIFFGGVTLLTGGIILSINSSKAMKYKNKMKALKPKQVSVTLGMQQNGLGISLKF